MSSKLQVEEADTLNYNSGVYEIRNTVNDKYYIGGSKDLKDRKEHHFYCLNRGIHGNDYLQKSWNKYGESGFEFNVVLYCNKENVDYYEQHYLNEMNIDSDNNYNMAKYVDNPMRGRKHTEEARKRMSESTKKQIERQGHPLEGVGHTEESKEKMRETTLQNFEENGHPCEGREYSKQTINKMRNDGKTNKLTEVQIVNIKNLLEYSNLLQREIADLYSVNQQQISRINTGHNWDNIKINE